MNAPVDDLTVFATVHRPQLMMAWFEAERAKAYKVLKVDRDPVGLHQAQGRVQLLDKMIELLEKAQHSK